MLPKPRNATLKQTNRTLIPYTLTKKPAAAKPPQRLAAKPSPSRPPAAASASAKRAAATATIAGGGGGGGSNDEEEETGTSSFFSFGEPAVAPSVPAVSVTPVSEVNRFKALVTSSSSAPSEDGPSSSANPAPSTTTKATGESVHNRDWPSVASSVPYNLEPSGTPRDSPPAFQTSDPPSGQDAPLSFSKPMPTAMQYGQPAGQYAQTQAYSAPYGYDYSQYNQPYQGSDPEVPVDGQPTGSGPAQSNESLSGLAEDKEFQRLMGKRNVSREAINVVDIAADEQIGPTNHLDWMKKNLSEEKEFRAKLRKEQLPSGQQKRKHQITYLAHQAKERELELKNQWANNRQTRKDTQMKYGF